MKSFTAKKLIDALINNPKENSSNTRFKFWEHENHPVLLETTDADNNYLNYTHENTVTAGFVAGLWY